MKFGMEREFFLSPKPRNKNVREPSLASLVELEVAAKEAKNQRRNPERRRLEEAWRMGARELFRSVPRIENEDHLMEY